MSAREPIQASVWWRAADNTFEKILREELTRAQKADRKETGHDCGHRFEITVRSSTHIGGTGEHVDADYYDSTQPVEVRAHNLRDALLIAAGRPLGDWFPEEAAS